MKKIIFLLALSFLVFTKNSNADTSAGYYYERWIIVPNAIIDGFNIYHIQKKDGKGIPVWGTLLGLVQTGLGIAALSNGTGLGTFNTIMGGSTIVISIINWNLYKSQDSKTVWNLKTIPIQHTTCMEITFTYRL